MNRTTIKLTALLRQLSTVSPRGCRMNDCGEWQILDTETGHWLHLYDVGEIDPFRVAGLVQQRIEARGWTWSICRAIDHEDDWIYVAMIEGLDEPEEFAEDTPAAALLTAYLAAIEAQTAEDADA